MPNQGRHAVILLVDDDPGDQELTRRALTEGVVRTDLRVVSNGEEALSYLRNEGKYEAAGSSPRPDLILLDLNMPRIDGRDVLKEMKSDSRLRNLPVVVLTTSNQEADILRSYDLGCNAFITKPIAPEAFMAAIRELEAFWFELVTLPSH